MVVEGWEMEKEGMGRVEEGEREGQGWEMGLRVRGELEEAVREGKVGPWVQ
jgi:hypothetical protein